MTVQDYFRHFDSTFSANVSDNIDINKTQILKNVFEHMPEFFFNISDEKRRINNDLIKTETKLVRTFDKEQKNIFEDYQEVENKSNIELAQQILVFGFSLAFQELKEMNALK